MQDEQYNLIKLFPKESDEFVLSESDTRIAATATSVLALNEQLSHSVKELSRHFDSVENAIDTIEDIKMRTRLRLSIKLRREDMSKTVLEFSRHIDALVGRLKA